MRTIEYGTTTTHVPAFLTKLWKLVTDASCDDLISWSLAGTSFIIFDEIRFSKELLPMYFKHNNMASFVRQLNMYGFRKLSCIDQGGMHCYKNEIEFYHQYFLKGQETLLELIKRKIPNSKSDEPKVKQEYIEELISNVKALKGKTEFAEKTMENLDRENKALWDSIQELTDRYRTQQAVIHQLFPFFINVVRPHRELPLKRKAPLMIDEGDSHHKMSRMSPPYYVQEDSNSGMPSSPGNVTNRGPVIHDVTEMESSKMFPASILCPPNTTTSKECEAIVDSPLSCSLERSEQSIDSPFTEPASMETLNILNQNFERRSRSNSLNTHMDMRRSPKYASTSSIGIPSPCSIGMPSPCSIGMPSPCSIGMPSPCSIGMPSPCSIGMPSPCSMPGSSNSMSSFTSASSGIPSTVIIDETTSDVPSSPISDRLIRSPFVPKIEDTCTDSGMYTMKSMLSDRVSSVINEETVSMLNGGSRIMGEGALPQINDGASTSSGNKFTQNDFISNVKSDLPEMNWLMNQTEPIYGSEPNFENWLGQIFKSDNLTPGCSLPQQQQQEQVGNVNFVQ